MAHVTWGSNTTHVFSGSATPATPGKSVFGAQAPATPAAGGFGTPTLGSSPAPSTTNLFSSAPAPAPTGGGLFGSSTAPASTTLFGTSTAPAPTGNLFGTSAPAPATSGVFGSSTSAFGSAPSSSLFGSTPGSSMSGAQQQQRQQMPAQAALQAHMDASARQEQERIRVALEKLHAIYTGVAPQMSDKVPFVCIVYNEMSPEQLQLQFTHRLATHASTPIAPPKPPHVAEKQWLEAVVQNPDPERYVPMALVGADMLRMRVVWQQERSNSMKQAVAQLQSTHEVLHNTSQQFQGAIDHLTRSQMALRKRLLNTMRKVEVARCMNMNVQPDEIKAGQRLSELVRQVGKQNVALESVRDALRNQPRPHPMPQGALPDEKRLKKVLEEQKDGLEKLKKLLHHDMKDVSLLQQRLAQTVSLPPSIR